MARRVFSILAKTFGQIIAIIALMLTTLWGPSGASNVGGLLMEWKSAFTCLSNGCAVLP